MFHKTTMDQKHGQPHLRLPCSAHPLASIRVSDVPGPLSRGWGNHTARRSALRPGVAYDNGSYAVAWTEIAGLTYPIYVATWHCTP